jgi:4-phospho-D-threonate 3-dehydrogenase / 4-phospho-D-erythronate 3-dehydrogenase
MSKPLIGITMGDPAGVGPELCLRALASRTVRRACVPVVFGDDAVLRRAAEACTLPRPPAVVSLADWRAGRSSPPAFVVDCGAIGPEAFHPGFAQKACGRAAVAYVQEAVRAAQAGRIRALATAPVHKEALHRAGVPYPGHTEMLAALTGAGRVRMMMASRGINVCLVTTHLAYADVPKLLTRAAVSDTIALAAQAMRAMGRRSPRLTVCGLNPHGGEHGLFGREERLIIAPAVRAARRQGLNVEGPLSPDTAFLPERRKRTDVYVVMYHDQGLIPFKMLAFEKGVNVTLGLPIIRTSVDHGTAFDIAWKGVASAASLVQSILLAVRLL